MPPVIVQPQTKSIEEILRGPGFYTIPRFQRPFSWSVDHIDEFWNDAIENQDLGYFIGPMVLYRIARSEWGIVDGQQRLTTITLILVAIRDRLDELGERDLADGIHEFIERKDPDRRNRFVIQSDVDDGSWIRNAQLRDKDSPATLGRASDPPQRAFELIKDRLAKALEPALQLRSKKGTRDRAVALLRGIRDQLLSLSVIWVPLDEEDDAYVIFETLNSRGKDLELADLVKNFFLSNLRAANANVDDARHRWNAIRDKFAAESGADINRFILHWWLSQQPYVAERRVFKEIKRTIRRAEASQVFTAFEEDSERYLTIIQPQRARWTQERMPVHDSLQALRIMRLAQPLPMVLSLMRAYEQSRIALRQLKTMLELIEKYHFQVTAISARSSSGGVSEMYAAHARRLTEASTADSRRACLDELARKLRDRAPQRDDFIESFEARLVFTETHARDKQLVQYVLGRLHNYERPSPRVDFRHFTIEHIRSQHLVGNQRDVEVIGSIGNLLFVDKDLNHKLGNRSFPQKQRILRSHRTSYSVDDVLVAREWNESEIRERARRLARLAYDEVWRI